MLNQDTSNGKKSDVEHMIDLLLSAKKSDMGILPISVRDVFLNPDKFPFSDTKYSELTQALIYVDFFEESQGFFKLRPSGYDFCRKIENQDIYSKVLAEIGTNRSLSITDVRAIVEKY